LTVETETWYNSIKEWTFDEIIGSLFIKLAEQEGKQIWGVKMKLVKSSFILILSIVISFG